MDYIFQLLASFIAVTTVLTFHEFAHAFIAYRCGDPTPKWNKRLTLNPLKHFDVLGLICFTLAGFGWAKPVPIEPSNFRHYRRGLAFTAVAGVVMNYLMAFLFYPLLLVVVYYLHVPVLTDFLYYLLKDLFLYSLTFCVFNLLPLNPLDGFRVVDACVKRHGRAFERYRTVSYYVLLFLIIESFICRIFTDYLGVSVIGTQGVLIMDYLNILGWIMKFVTNIFSYPITALWGLIPW